MKLNGLLLKVAEGAYGDMDREVFIRITIRDGDSFKQKKIPIQSAYFGQEHCCITLHQETIDAHEFEKPY